MGSQYYYPSFTMPGCPPPIDTLFTASGVPHTLGAPLAPPCALRSPTIPPYLTNVAVPGATTFDPVSTLPTVSSNALTLFILGGRSQVEAAADAHPTFLSVWIGNNDVLGAATDQTNAGDPTKVTPVALFTANYDAMLADLDTISTLQGAILVGVADVAAIWHKIRARAELEAQSGGLACARTVIGQLEGEVARARLAAAGIPSFLNAWTVQELHPVTIGVGEPFGELPKRPGLLPLIRYAMP